MGFVEFRKMIIGNKKNCTKLDLDRVIRSDSKTRLKNEKILVKI